MTMHHIVSDGWSMGVLYRELSVLYEAFSRYEPSPLSELPIQYADFAVWQQEWLQGEELDEQLSYGRSSSRDIPGYSNCRRIGPGRRCRVIGADISLWCYPRNYPIDSKL